MLGFVVRRLLAAGPLLVGASALVFVMVFALPGDPVNALGGGRRLPPATRQAIEARYHLDEPLPVQYGLYLGRLAHGDLGESYVQRRPVRDIVTESLPSTLWLGTAALVLETAVGLVLGIGASVSRGRIIRAAVLGGSAFVIGVPGFILGVTSQYLFGVRWHVLPVAGREDGWRSLILPAAVLAALGSAWTVRILQSSLEEALDARYVLTARSKGAGSAAVVGRHALPNALGPLVTFLGLDFGALVGGAVVVERIFNLDGIGSALFRAVRLRDNVTVVGISLTLIAVVVLANLVADVLLVLLDPRLRS